MDGYTVTYGGLIDEGSRDSFFEDYVFGQPAGTSQPPSPALAASPVTPTADPDDADDVIVTVDLDAAADPLPAASSSRPTGATHDPVPSTSTSNAIQLVKTTKDNVRVSYNGGLYNLQRASVKTDMKKWRCREYYKTRCRAELQTNLAATAIRSSTGEHNHDLLEEEDLKMLKVVQDIIDNRSSRSTRALLEDKNLPYSRAMGYRRARRLAK